MCAATGLIAGIISLGENVSDGMEHSGSVSHEGTNLSGKGGPAANTDETTEEVEKREKRGEGAGAGGEGGGTTSRSLRQKASLG